FTQPLLDANVVITSISSMTTHMVQNSDSSRPDLPGFGRWSYGDLLPAGSGAREWQFGDDGDGFSFAGEVRAAICDGLVLDDWIDHCDSGAINLDGVRESG